MRSWAALGLALLLGCPAETPSPPPPPPAPAPAPVTATDASSILEAVVRARCTDPTEPWALAHGILVFGKDLRLPGGDLAIDRLVCPNLIPGELRFPRQRAGQPIEPHPGLFTKTLLEVGVAETYAFPGRSGVTLGALAQAEAERYLPDETLPFHNEAWVLETIAWADPERAQDLGAQALEVLIRNQRYFEEYRDPKVPYKKPFLTDPGGPQPAHIHRYFCGGLHLFQAIQRLHGAECPPDLAAQYELLLLRIPREGDYWERKLRQAKTRFQGEEQRGHARVILSQRLKLIGHALETYLRGVRAGALTLEDGPKALLDKGFDDLEATVLSLREHGIYKELDALRRTRPQLYLDLVGDSAHALHAIRLRESK